MTVRQIIGTATHIVSTPHRYEKLSTTIVLGAALWPHGVEVTKGPDLRGQPVAAKEEAVKAQHKALWEKCRESGKPMCILEDDAWCLNPFHPILDHSDLIRGDSLLLLGATYPKITAISDGLARLGSAMGTHAYVITPESADSLCRIDGKRVVDHITDAAIKTGTVRGIMPVPEMFCQLDAPGDIARRQDFEHRHRGQLSGKLISADQLLGDTALTQCQMSRSLAVPQPRIRDQARDRDSSDWGIGEDDAAVLTEIIRSLQGSSTGAQLTVLEFGPGRSTTVFLRKGCIVRSFESSSQRVSGFGAVKAQEGALRVRHSPLHPKQISLPELCASTGFGYDLAFVDAPSWSRETGVRNRRITLQCALRCAGTVILHDAHKDAERRLLFDAAQSEGRCIRLIDTKIGMAVLFRKGSLVL